ncbi:hypothetical protein AAFM46_11850 [Arthrobacter sp. TMP15]|uniref:hypothetical protein n=1 Tax=Arthrobacter sp. TMP15 TaxID=3140789 RepID=UPI0031BB5711
MLASTCAGEDDAGAWVGRAELGLAGLGLAGVELGAVMGVGSDGVGLRLAIDDWEDVLLAALFRPEP